MVDDHMVVIYTNMTAQPLWIIIELECIIDDGNSQQDVIPASALTTAVPAKW